MVHAYCVCLFERFILCGLLKKKQLQKEKNGGCFHDLIVKRCYLSRIDSFLKRDKQIKDIDQYTNHHEERQKGNKNTNIRWMSMTENFVQQKRDEKKNARCQKGVGHNGTNNIWVPNSNQQ